MSEYIPTDDELSHAQRRPRGKGDVLPPHSIETEQAVLGCILEDPGAAMDACTEKFGGAGPTVFYDLRHATLFERMRELWETQKPINLVSIQQTLRDRGQLEDAGGLGYIVELQSMAVPSGMLGYHIDTLLEKHTCRELVRFGSEVASQAHAVTDVPNFVAQVQTQALSITESGIQTKLKSVQPILKTYIELLEKRKNGRQQITGIKTGLHMFDNFTCGLQPGEMTVIAARPSVGKTALGVTFTIQALRDKHRVAFFSLEMSEQSIMPRFLGAVARVDSLKMRNGFVSKSDEIRLVKAVEEMAGWKSQLFIDDRSDLTGRDLFTAARRAKRDHGVDMIVVDYIQLMHAVKQHGTREGEVGEIADWIKRTAKDLDMVVVALAQTNKESERDRTPREPRMSDIRESDRICQNADVVGLLWAPKLEDEDYFDMKWIRNHDADDPKENDGWNGDRRVVEYQGDRIEFPVNWRKELTFVQMVVAKNRNGATGPCELVLQRRTTRFCDAHRDGYGEKAKQTAMEGVEV